jgi:DNA-directed RNA polymerase specialized sigma24 family protein
MSPLSLRRFRAERLLRRDFERLRITVLSGVRSRLGGSTGGLDASDLEACYANAWHGLYAAVLGGEQIANPAGWLVVVTTRRAIDERRSRRLGECRQDVALEGYGHEPDVVARLDEMRQLRELFQGLRERLNARECEAATLCYLQGLSRQQAARRMGMSAKRMRKLMDGDGAGREGVARKVGELLAVIRADEWCAQRSSMMRALAFGILDPRGERYRLALAHQRECPACRRYVLSLRGLAAILPPLALPTGIGAGASAGAGSCVGAGGGLASGAVSGGGTWPLAGSLGGKLAAGLAALSVAAGGAVIATGGRLSPTRDPRGTPSSNLSRPAAQVTSEAWDGNARAAAEWASAARSATPRGSTSAATRSSSGGHPGATSGAPVRGDPAGLEFGIENPRPADMQPQPGAPAVRYAAAAVSARAPTTTSGSSPAPVPAPSVAAAHEAPAHGEFTFE